MKENLFTENCIRTRNGLYVNVFDPKPEMFDIKDIAWALSMQPRFGGHLCSYYSVANHCNNACYLTDGDKLEALMHDCSEAYLLDIPRPIKQNLSNYKEIEHNLFVVLSSVFGFQYPFSENTKRVDEKLLQMEWDSMMIKLPEIPSYTLNPNWYHQLDTYGEFLRLYERYKK